MERKEDMGEEREGRPADAPIACLRFWSCSVTQVLLFPDQGHRECPYPYPASENKDIQWNR